MMGKRAQASFNWQHGKHHSKYRTQCNARDAPSQALKVFRNLNPLQQSELEVTVTVYLQLSSCSCSTQLDESQLGRLYVVEEAMLLLPMYHSRVSKLCDLYCDVCWQEYKI
jgi:hypothetical protein